MRRVPQIGDPVEIEQAGRTRVGVIERFQDGAVIISVAGGEGHHTLVANRGHLEHVAFKRWRIAASG